jgi:tetratricopeptide (TPR) repeat protein
LTGPLPAAARQGSDGCEQEADRILSLTDEKQVDGALGALEAAYRRCGAGYGLLSAMAQLQLARGKFDDAKQNVQRELLAPHPSGRALSIAVTLVARLPPAEAQTLRELGRTADAPVHLPSLLGDRTEWLTGVTCQGASPRGFAMSRPDAGSPVRKAYVECPTGDKHDVFLVDDRPPRATVPTPPFDGPTPVVNAIVESLRTNWGIGSPGELKQELLEGTPSRSHAWLLAFVRDLPGRVTVWGKLIEKDRDDLEAIYYRAQDQAKMEDLGGAIATLAAASPSTARLRDLRGAVSFLQSSAIRSYHCAYLFRQRRLEEARARCEEGLAAGSRTVSNAYLARIALLKGDLAAADAYSAKAAEHGLEGELTLRAFVLILEGRPEEARPWLERVEKGQHPLLSARRLLQGEKQSAATFLAGEEVAAREDAASELAVGCGVPYLELGVTQRAERCLQLADKLVYGPADAARAIYMSETNPQKALQVLEPVLSKSSHPDVLVAMATIQHRLGRDAEALPFLDQALAQWPVYEPAKRALTAVCDKLGGASCVEKHFPARPEATSGPSK